MEKEVIIAEQNAKTSPTILFSLKILSNIISNLFLDKVRDTFKVGAH